jgi:hypothetical protein
MGRVSTKVAVKINQTFKDKKLAFNGTNRQKNDIH